MNGNESLVKDIFFYNRLKELGKDYDDESSQNPQSWSAFIMVLVLKLIPLGLFLSDPFLKILLGEMVLEELIVFFTVTEFWITKNILGSKMIGLKWGWYDQPISGEENLQYECRINKQYNNYLVVLLFWIIESLYVIFPFTFLLLQFFTAPNVRSVDFRVVVLTGIIFVGAMGNYYFYIKAAISCKKRQEDIISKLGMDYVRTLNRASFRYNINL